METMEIIDAESQMMVLQDTLVEGEEQPSDEVEDLSNSLREAVQDGAVKPKLHCLMMDPSFSMVTVQSEDSGIVWETVSSRCSTPWASEMNITAPEPACAFSSPAAAGKIVVIMEEELTGRREKRKPRPEKTKTLPYMGDEIMRPAMVEVSLPNITQEEDKTTDTKEEKHQRLFSLVSEGSEILNIIAPPKVSMVDEEESKDLQDCLFYLEEIPPVKSTKTPDEPVIISVETPAANIATSVVISEPIVVVPSITASRRDVTAEDYFEKFTLLDHQIPSGPAEDADQEMEISTEDTLAHNEDDAPGTLNSGLSRVPLAISMLDISGDHLDVVFYGGGGGELRRHQNAERATKERRELSKSSLKESGTALFRSEESVLTPIYLPEGPPKIIDPNLLEEPKAMAFLYSDLYADAVGRRKKQEDDAESLTSEKSFHSRESDSEDRGYLEKFVLKVEMVADGGLDPEVRKEERQHSFRLAGYVEEPKTGAEMKPEELEEITDFFRTSASSSPCEPVDLYQSEPEEEPQTVRTTQVTFKDKVMVQTEKRQESNSLPFTDDIDFEEAFLPVEISEDCPAWEETLPPFHTTSVKSTSSRTDDHKNKPKSRSETFQEPHTLTQMKNTLKPIIPHHKAFLDLSPLLPAETEDEERQTDGDKSVSEEARSEEEMRKTPPDDEDPPDVHDDETVDKTSAV